MIPIRQFAIVTFNCCCTILAAYMTIKQISTYLNNEDESVISFEDIKEASAEDFATYTICFMTNHGVGMYKRDERIYAKKSYLDGPVHLGNTGFILELEGNKLALRNMSEVKDTGRFWSSYDVDDPRYNFTNFYYNEFFNPVRCDNGEMPLRITKEDKASIKYCLEERENPSFQFYENYIQIHGNLMSTRQDGKVYVMNPYQYQRILMGKESMFKFQHSCIEGETQICKHVPIIYSLEDIADIDFDERTTNLTEYLLDYDITEINGSNIAWYKDLYRKIETKNLFVDDLEKMERQHIENAKTNDFFERRIRSYTNPFKEVYQDPTRQCYTPRVNRLNTRLIKKKERITLDLLEISKSYNTLFGSESTGTIPFFEIHVHLQGQFVRSLGKEISAFNVNDFLADCPEYVSGHFGFPCYGSSLSFDLSQVTLLNSRHDAKSPCNPNTVDEDTQILETVLNQTGIRCIPIYWKSIIENKFNYRECTTDLQYRMIAETTGDFVSFEEVRSSLNPPCTEMIIVTNVEKVPGRKERKYSFSPMDPEYPWLYEGEMMYLDINVRHVSDRYQAISNLRGFTGESCWAGVGGFVGIFVGVSLMQIPEILLDMFNLIKNLKSRI